MRTSTTRPLLLSALLLLAAPAARAATVCPGPDAEWGIDVSEYQGNIDWAQVKNSGHSFAIIRVSDGTGHFNPYFDKNWSGAKNAGLIRGVYQFFEPGEDPVAQANLLLQHMGAIGPGDLPPMIDVEVTGGQSPATITARIHQWVDTIQAATGRKALVYTGTWFWDPKVGSGDFASYPLVESYYCNNCCPNLPNPWNKWAMWQYSSTGAVPGIGGNVDLDRFDGNLAALQQLAGGDVDWSAHYVSQSWPLATASLNLTVNQSVAAEIEMKNTGAKGWDGNTRLGTTMPRDRPSVFAASDSIGANRAAACKAGAAPGASCKFQFNFQAPNAPGDYHEYFGMVQEGVAWFSDNGQGGPPDNDIEAWIHVSEADYHGAFVAQSYPPAPQGSVGLTVGQTIDGWIDLKNVGTQTWKAGETRLAPTARDQPSKVAAADWLSATRVSTVAADVPPGAVGRFPLSLRGTTVGDFEQTFALVEEGVTWFADAPKGGGPADDLLKVHVVVTAGGEFGGDGGAPAAHDGGASKKGNGDGGALSTDDAGSDAPAVVGGCSVTQRRSPTGSALFVLFAGALLLRRARRSARR